MPISYGQRYGVSSLQLQICKHLICQNHCVLLKTKASFEMECWQTLIVKYINQIHTWFDNKGWENFSY